MRTVVVVWQPEAAALAAIAPGGDVRTSLADQGPFAGGSPFDALVLGGPDLDPAAVRGAEVWAWRVEEHVPRPGPDDCAVAMVSLMRRRPGMTPAEFATHWTEGHGPLALHRHVGLADYHQFVVVDPLTPTA